MINTTTALTAANTKTDIVLIEKGDFKLSITGTFVATIVILRKLPVINASTPNNGTHTGANGAAAMTDANRLGVTADELIGLWIRNDTDGSMGLITDNTATVDTATLAGGTQNDWDTGESWSLWEVLETYSTNQKLIGVETKSQAEYIALMSAWTSGTARVLISEG